MTKVPSTRSGVVKVSPPGRLPHLCGLMMPLVLSHLRRGEKCATMLVPAGVVARISRAALAMRHTCVLMRSTSSKSARMPSSMMRRSIFTMWAWRILRRFTTSVICMRVRSSLACARTAKMLTWLVSISSSTAGGISVSGRGARSSRIQALYAAPRRSSSRARAAAISWQAWSVMSVTFSSGWMRRQCDHGVARAGREFGVEREGLQLFAAGHWRGLRRRGHVRFRQSCNPPPVSGRWSRGRRATGGRRRCPPPECGRCRRSRRGCPVRRTTSLTNSRISPINCRTGTSSCLPKSISLPSRP